MRLAPYLFALSLGSCSLACSSSPVTTTTIARPELVAVSPDDFLGRQQCGDGPELVGSYVATLFDVTTASDGGAEAGTGLALASSPPTPCAFPVTFSFVLTGHRYRAEVDAYDRLARVNDDDTEPTHIEAVSLGGRTQRDETGATVAPHWTAVCGGYPATGPDGGQSDVADAAIQGATTYDALTTTVHDCQTGLEPVQ